MVYMNVQTLTNEQAQAFLCGIGPCSIGCLQCASLSSRQNHLHKQLSISHQIPPTHFCQSLLARSPPVDWGLLHWMTPNSAARRFEQIQNVCTNNLVYIVTRVILIRLQPFGSPASLHGIFKYQRLITPIFVTKFTIHFKSAPS